jgi:hypothetical protein
VSREPVFAILGHSTITAVDYPVSPPQDYGLSGNRWDGVVVVEYLKRLHETTRTYYGTMMHLEAAGFSRSQRWKPLKVKRICYLI